MLDDLKPDPSQSTRLEEWALIAALTLAIVGAVILFTWSVWIGGGIVAACITVVLFVEERIEYRPLREWLKSRSSKAIVKDPRRESAGR